MKISPSAPFILFLVFCCSSGYAQKYNTNFIPYRFGDKWGYCDKSKKIVIAPRFKEANLFPGAIAHATSFDSGSCVINQKGKVIYYTKRYVSVLVDGKHFIPGNISDTEQVFDEHVNPVTKKYYDIMSTEYGYWSTYGFYIDQGLDRGFLPQGILDSTFKEVLPAMYYSIDFLTKDLVKIFDDGKKKYGVMNLKTKKYFAVDYDQIYPPLENRLMVRKGDLYGFMDMNGVLVIPAKYGKATPEDTISDQRYSQKYLPQYNYDGFYEGLAVVVDGGKSGYIDKDGKTVIPFNFDKAYGFKDGYAWVRMNGKWGMINKQGKYIVQPLYKSPVYTIYKDVLYLEGFHDGLVALSVDSLYGYFDATGKMVIPFTYPKAEPFYDGIAAIYQDGKWGFINKKGEFIIKPQYKSVVDAGIAGEHPFQYGCAIVQEMDGRWIVIDKKGMQMIPLRFDASNKIEFVDNLASAVVNGKRYLFDNKGHILYAFDTDAPVWRWTPDLFYNQRDKYYFNPKTKVKYAD